MDQKRLKPADWPEALDDAEGRQIVVAGPGTGKTEFLVRRVGAILSSGRAEPSEIVVLSFSRRASARLRARIAEVSGETGMPVDVATFHSLAIRLVEAVTGGERPLPLTTPEQVGLVRDTLREESPEAWPVHHRGVLDSQPFAEEVADFLLRCSERLLTPADVADRATMRADWRGLAALYTRYLARLDAMGRTDYGVLLARAVELLRTDQGTSLASDYRYVIVDEYQDTSPAQAEMAELLARPHCNLTVAGDPYQSIFSFRGAEVRNIATFSETADTRRIVLTESFRVPKAIMDAALGVIAGGDLPGAAGIVEPAPHQGRCEVYVFDQETAEAEWIASEVEHLVRVEGLSPNDIAIVVRSKRRLLPELSRALDRRSLPHDPPDTRLVDHPAVRLIGDLVVVASKGGPLPDTSGIDSEAADRSMRRVLLGPLVGLTVSREREIMRHRRRTGEGWPEIMSGAMPEMPGLIGLLTDRDWSDEMSAGDGFWEVWTRLEGIGEMVTDSGRDEWRRAWTAFSQMLGRQAERDPSVTLARFFELVEEDDFEATPLISHRLSEDRVTLTTLHQAKGLQFEVVFIANAVEGVFPDLRRSRRMLRPELLSPERTVDPEAQQIFQVQEEMRLAYTAMTRARRRVVWTATEAGVDQGEHRPSRFLLAASGDETPGPPRAAAREPITILEAETALRRDLTDPSVPSARRLAAARVLADPSHSWWDATTFAGAVAPGPDQPVLYGSFRLSPSQADSYQRCPRRYVLERRLRLGDPSNQYGHLGQLAHDILEIAEREVLGTGATHAELDRVLEIVEEVWERADFGSPLLNDAWKRKAIDMLTKLYEHWPGKGVPVDVELDVEEEIAGVRWLGRIDRLEQTDHGYRVIDYKSSASLPTVAEAAESLQLAFYALAVGRSRGDVVAAEMWFPRKDSKKVLTREFPVHGLPGALTTMEEITNAIGSESWEPRVGKACKRCSFKSSCPAWPEGRGAYLP